MGEQGQELDLSKKQCNKEKEKSILTVSGSTFCSKYKGFSSFLEYWGSIGVLQRA